jgi:transcriptional regulator with XRE-family HTH domain
VNIGKGIAYFLDERGMTAAQLAEIVGLSQSALSMYINDKRNPSEESLHKIAQALDVSMKVLIERAEEESRKKGIVRDPDRNYIAHRRRMEMIHRNNSVVLELTPDLIIGIQARLYDLNNEEKSTGFRDRLPSSLEAIFENVIRDVFRFHKDEIIDRLHHELSYTEKGVNDIITELESDNF